MRRGAASDRRGLGWLGIGGSIALAVQLLAPVGRPLYDGVVPTEPYRYLSPASGQAGEPTSFVADSAVADGRSPAITAATSENPPQAQLIALADSFAVPAGATTLRVTIGPVPPDEPAPAEGAIAGNVYRIAVNDPAGDALAIKASQLPTLAMRAPDGVVEGRIARFADGRWELLETIHATGLGIYSTEPDRLGDFAILDLVGTSQSAGTLSPVAIAVGATAAVLVVAGLVVYLVRRNRRAVEAAGPPIPRRRAPPKRRRR